LILPSPLPLSQSLGEGKHDLTPSSFVSQDRLLSQSLGEGI
jgi:hypothetical protein